MRGWLLMLVTTFVLAADPHAPPASKSTTTTPPPLRKPPVLLIDFDHAENFVRARASNASQLQACGFEPTEKRLNGNETEEELKKLIDSLSTEVPIVMTGFHGEAVTDPKRLFPTGLQFKAGDNLVDGLALVRRLQTSAPKAPVFLDTCYSGVCQVTGPFGIATATCHNEKSTCAVRETNQTIPEREMIRTLCDSIDQCSIFNGVRKSDGSGWEKPPYDTEPDGFLDGEELTKYFRDTAASPKGKATRSQTAQLITRDAKVLQQAKSDCTAKGRTPQIEESDPVVYRVVTRRLRADGTVMSEQISLDDPVYLFTRRKGESFDQSPLIAAHLAKQWKGEDNGHFRMTDVTATGAKITANFNYSKDTDIPLEQQSARRESTVERTTTKEYRVTCEGGDVAHAVGEGDSVQHPVFPKSYRIRCRQNAKKIGM